MAEFRAFPGVCGATNTSRAGRMARPFYNSRMSVRQGWLGRVAIRRTRRGRLGRLLPGDRLGLADQRRCDDLVDMRDGEDAQPLLHVVRDLREILLIVLRDEDRGGAA